VNPPPRWQLEPGEKAWLQSISQRAENGVGGGQLERRDFDRTENERRRSVGRDGETGAGQAVRGRLETTVAPNPDERNVQRLNHRPPDRHRTAKATVSVPRPPVPRRQLDLKRLVEYTSSGVEWFLRAAAFESFQQDERLDGRAGLASCSSHPIERIVPLPRISADVRQDLTSPAVERH
jgi:hypothetical protein